MCKAFTEQSYRPLQFGSQLQRYKKLNFAWKCTDRVKICTAYGKYHLTTRQPNFSCSFQILLQAVALCRIQTWGDKRIKKVSKIVTKKGRAVTFTPTTICICRKAARLKITRLWIWIINNWHIPSHWKTNNTTISSGFNKNFHIWGMKTTTFTVSFSLSTNAIYFIAIYMYTDVCVYIYMHIKIWKCTYV